MLKFKIITSKSCVEINQSDLIEEAYDKAIDEYVTEVNDILFQHFGNHETFKIHAFDSAFFDETIEYLSFYSVDEMQSELVESLAIKEGVELVQFENGNIGFVAYYGNSKNGLEIIPCTNEEYEEEN